VCWSHCPSGFTDTGVDCLKPKSYGRGAGYAIWSKGTCDRHNSQGCEKWGAMWYPNCRANFHNVACCVCSPDCPDGMTDIGVSCQKHSYGRTAGKPLVCAAGLQEDAALCYKPCTGGKGVGPVCWQQCGGEYPASCAGQCAKTALDCGSAVTDMVKSVMEDVATVAETVASEGADIDVEEYVKNAAETAKAFAAPMCPGSVLLTQ
jgi:hypothetical protein